MKKRIWIPSVCLVLVAVCVLQLASLLLEPKYMETNREGALIAEYYNEDVYFHDVLFIGDCEVYESFTPPTLWEEAIDRIVARHANVETAEKMIEEMRCGKAAPKKPARSRTRGMLRDVRVFYNSVDRAVEMVRRCGIPIETEREEAEGETRLIIRIPRSG